MHRVTQKHPPSDPRYIAVTINDNDESISLTKLMQLMDSMTYIMGAALEASNAHVMNRWRESHEPRDFWDLDPELNSPRYAWQTPVSQASYIKVIAVTSKSPITFYMEIVHELFVTLGSTTALVAGVQQLILRATKIKKAKLEIESLAAQHEEDQLARVLRMEAIRGEIVERERDASLNAVRNAPQLEVRAAGMDELPYF